MNFDFIENMTDFLSTNIGIDLGTANTPIFVKNKGISICEPSYIAIDRNQRKILAVGHTAKHMEGRVPKHIEVVRPVKDGIISDFEATAEMLNHLMRRIERRNAIVGPKVIIGIPSKASPLEERAVLEAVIQAGGRKVYTIEQILGAAIGMDMAIMEAKGNMLIDIGGGTTQVAVISMGGCVVNENIDIAGDKLTEKIISFMRQNYSLSIGNNTGEEIKIFLGSAYPNPDEISMQVKGSDIKTGLPRTIKVQEGEIREVLIEPLKEMMDIIKISLQKTPPELMSDIQEDGIMLTGGTALLRGLDKLIEKVTGIKVKIPKDPIYTVANGLGELLQNQELFRQFIKEKKQIKYQV